MTSWMGFPVTKIREEWMPSWRRFCRDRSV
jgi:hypothetical protein